jgi:flagellar motor switch protein FliM
MVGKGGRERAPPLPRSSVTDGRHSVGERRRSQLSAFPWDEMERLRRDDVEAQEHLDAYLPHPAMRATLVQGLSERMQELLGGEVSFELDHCVVVRSESLRKLLDVPSVLAIVSASPHGPRGLIEVDLGLAQGCIELLLGAGGRNQPLTPLTQIEEGVVSYLLLEALRVAQGRWADGAKLRLRLTGMAPSLDGARDVLAEEKRFAVFELKISADAHAGHVRLILPWRLVEKHTGPAKLEELAPPAQEAWLRWTRESMARIASCPVSVAARVGRTQLTGAELSSIEVGDVVVVEDVTLSPSFRAGRAWVVIGNGRSMRLGARVMEQGNRYAVAIDRFEKIKEPNLSTRSKGPDAEAVGQGGQAAEEGDNLRETSGLLSDVPVTLHVELGRMELAAEQVIALRVGKVISLDRAPGDPVDLVVNGRLIAQGDLVQVDGQVGVRIAKLR